MPAPSAHDEDRQPRALQRRSVKLSGITPRSERASGITSWGLCGTEAASRSAPSGGGAEGVFCPQPALHLTPPRLARVEQSQIDRRYAKNPDHGRLGRSLPDTVIMWCVRDPPDEASGRYRNGGVGVEVA